ncbi:ATP-dependent RNA helicase HrpA [Kocuria marina]|uniref:ATP-dependent RNA helicase HrpA n=1 Tax=Kocuria marina TaxID=223184 RepID=UPI0019CF628D|nr:ATP-dependent RNA helicase HrpA [Kocuria indica]MBN6811433.1 ATP-dependent RNA helicase HrpA [Kocuria indica]MBN6843127.1 ATP-dependent RNA helicase HrpA [Kocuria indica]
MTEPRIQPRIVYPDDLPVSARREDIMAAIRDHQVVVIAGETGSGKTTQLPKMCLELGLGDGGLIGHTQPRRIAARSVAERIAHELGQRVGDTVGYQVRFTSEVGKDSRIKLMTDGILLAEIGHDPQLSRYNAIIIDEAHERSLNIDFLLGYLKRLLPQRPDLKVVITSATIDPQRFAEHFVLPDPQHPDADPEPAPIIEVSGRTYPVEIRYRPLAQERSGDGGEDEDNTGDGLVDEDRDPIDAVCDAVVELSREPRGDILVFFAGEREIRDAQDALHKVIDSHRSLAGTQILPLFGRLSMAEQNRVFAPSSHRRIVLATNVAETSLTVPGIKYVIDPGTARISRYSARTKVQRLPIERISQASARQRAGRSGRTSDGVCIRLYSEEDFESRPEYTDPEILRTNLAAVILQMISVGVVEQPHDITQFPFVQKPDARAVKDGVVLLRELGALRSGAADAGDDAASSSARDGHRGRRSRSGRHRGRQSGPRGPLTRTGEVLAALPVDPRLGRMIVESQRRGCVREVLVLAAALTVQDPRERPLEKRQAADEFHARFRDKTSDFLSYGLLWQYLQEQQSELSSSQFRKLCRREYLNFLRIREWQDLYAQLRQIARQVGIDAGASREIDVASHQEAVHKSLLSGLLSNIGVRDERTREYRGARGTKFAIFPGSALFKTSPDWLVSAELVETSRLWARTNAAIKPEWAEEIAPQLVKRSYSEPHWSRSRGAVMAYEKVTLYGLPVVSERPVLFSRIDPELSRELFIRHALVEGDWQTRHTFVKRNRKALAQVEELENRMRRKDLRVDDQVLFDFYDARVPADVVSQRHFDAWWKKARQRDEHLLDLTPEDLIAPEVAELDTASFPRSWTVASPDGELSLDLDYEFAPGAETADGVTVRVPVLFLDRLAPEQFEWHIPGLRVELVTALIKSLPKAVRRNFVPAPDTAVTAVKHLDAEFDPARDSLLESLATVLRRLRGHPVQASDFHPEALPAHLRMRFEVRDARNSVLGRGDDLTELKQRLRPKVRAALAESLGGAAAQLYDAARGSTEGSASSSDDAAAARRGRGKRGSARPGPGTSPGSGAPRAASLERTDLTAWPEPDPPRRVETTVAGQTVTGYPTLVAVRDTDASQPPRVDLRILSDAEEQRAAQRDGVIALLHRTLPSVHRYVVDHLSQKERLIFTQNPHGSVEALITDCTIAAIDRLVPEEPPFTRDQFRAVAEHVRAELIDTVFAVTALVTTALTESNTVRKRLKKPGSLGAVAAFKDMSEQLSRLIYPGFVARTGWRALQHVPRYLAGINVRLDKLSGHLQRDAVAMQTVHDLEAEYRAAVDAVPSTVPTPAALRAVRWDLEELRISFFAQELGTAHTVSEKRIRKRLRELG